MPFRSGPSCGLQRRELRAHHAAAEHARLEAHFVRRADHARGVRRIRGDVHEVGIGRLDRADDRRVVDRVGRIGLVVDDLQPGALHLLARAFERASAGIPASAPTSAIVCGFGFRPIAASKKPLRPADRGLGTRPA